MTTINKYFKVLNEKEQDILYKEYKTNKKIVDEIDKCGHLT